MQQYKTLVQRIRQNGSFKGDRTGTGTLSVFGHEMRFDLAQGFPLVTLKSTFLPAIIHELLWFLSGSTNIKYLQDNNVRIWNEWADSEGNLGPVYGKQWRSWQATKEIICDPGDVITHNDGSKTYFNAKVKTEAVDQIAEVIRLLKTDPDSRRIIVSAWNPGELHQMALMPCHAFFQFYVANGKLSCMITQRSH